MYVWRDGGMEGWEGGCMDLFMHVCMTRVSPVPIFHCPDLEELANTMPFVRQPVGGGNPPPHATPLYACVIASFPLLPTYNDMRVVCEDRLKWDVQ